MIKTTSLLLDINYGEEVDNIITKFNQVGKPIFSFESTQHGDQGQKVFSNDELGNMILNIKDYLLKGETDV